MPAMDWNAEAKAAANYVLDAMFSTRRGTIEWCDGDVTVVFGNDGYGTDERSRREVAVLRMALEIAGLTELGFGLSDDEEQYTWAMIVNTADGGTLLTFLRHAAEISYDWSRKLRTDIAESKAVLIHEPAHAFWLGG
jgi:hypothetical protein